MPRLVPPRPDPLLGRVFLDQYTIRRRIGQGGFSTVYEAEQASLERKVVIKILHPHLSRSLNTVTRFRREAIISSRLRHPAAVRVHNAGKTPDGLFWMAMELLEGETLAARLARSGFMTPFDLFLLSGPVCGVLAEAHQEGIVHRDIKPENIMLVPFGKNGFLPKVLDFGIAGFQEGEQVTHSGVWGGSSAYMSPEHWKGLKYVDTRSDIYSLGVIFYQCLSGRLPFEGLNQIDWMSKHCFEPPSDLSDVLHGQTISPMVKEVILKALEKDPPKRYQSITEFQRSLEVALWSTMPTVCTANIAQLPTAARVPILPDPAFPPSSPAAAPEQKKSTTESVPCVTALSKDKNNETRRKTWLWRREARRPPKNRLQLAPRREPSSQTSGATPWLRGVWGSSSGKLFAVGNRGTVLRADAPEAFWQEMTSRVTEHLTSVWGNANELYIVGGGGAILRSEDQGDSFSRQKSGVTQWLWSVWGDGRGRIYAAGEQGTLLRSSDGGARWESLCVPTTEPLYGVWGDGFGSLWVIGRKGLILRSGDNGKTWEQKESHCTQNLQAVWGSALGEMIVVGRGGTILCSEDGGSTFLLRDSGVQTCLYGVWGRSTGEVYAVGNYGTILYSNDRGISWLSERLEDNHSLYGVWGSASEGVHAVGNGGTILFLPWPAQAALHNTQLVSA